MEHLIDALIERFKKDNVIDLTQEEELAILNSLTEDDMINNGTSRNVYRFRKDFVVKVAMSTGGTNQNKIERGYYEEHGDSGYFAELYACGKMINIMERLSECCYFEEDELGCYDEEDECYSRYQEILNVIENVNELTDYYGGDNGQVGFSRNDDCYKVYDYGYSMDYDRGEIVDDVECWWCVVLPLQNAINIVSGGELITPEEFWELREKIKGEELC
jgi:hypothetical protein